MWTYILLIWIHFVSDFVFQPRFIANNKGKNNWVLLLHACLYGALFIFFGWQFAILNAILHFFVDLGSSKLTTHFWTNNNLYGFFTTIGADQALHLTILLVTYNLLT